MAGVTLKGFVAPMIHLMWRTPSGLGRRSELDPRVAKAQPWAGIGQHLRCKKTLLKQEVVGLLHRVLHLI